MATRSCSRCSTGTASTARSRSAWTSTTASPRSSVPNDRTLAHAERSGGRFIPFVRLDLTERAARGGAPLPRPRRTRDQAPPARAGVRARRRAAPARLRARRRALGPDPDPRRPRATADRRAPRGAREAQRGRPAHRRPRGNRRHGRPRRTRSAGIPGVFFDTSVWSGRRPARPLPPGRTRAGHLRVRLPVRPPAELSAHGDFERRKPRASTTSSSAGCSARARAGSSTGEPLAAAHDAERDEVARPAADLRPHPPVHLDGGADALDAPARRDRRARARRQRLARAERLLRGGRADRGAPRDGPGALARGRRGRLRRRAHRGDARRRSSSSTSPT